MTFDLSKPPENHWEKQSAWRRRRISLARKFRWEGESLKEWLATDSVEARHTQNMRRLGRHFMALAMLGDMGSIKELSRAFRIYYGDALMEELVKPSILLALNNRVDNPKKQ